MNSSTLTEWVGRHRRSLLFLLLLPVLAGIGAALSLPVALFPNIQFPRVRISLDAGDRPAQQMVLQVTTPIEQALLGIPRLTDVRSVTSRGAAEISATFEWGTDMIAAALQVNAAINQVMAQLPPATASTVRRMDPTVFPIIAYSLTSQTVPLTTLRDIGLFQLRPVLTGVSGVAQIGVTGGQDEEFQILVNAARLAAYGLSFDDVAKAVASANVLSAVGRLEDHYKLFLVVANEILNGVDPIRHTVVKTLPDGVVTVDDVATVRRSTAPQWIRVTANGHDAVLINVYQQPGGNSVEIARNVKARLDEIQSKLPPGVSIANWYDQSQLVTTSAASVRDAIMIGAVLAALVLLVFLRSWRVTLIALLVVQASLSATIVLLYALQMSFNIMTLGGMAAAVGLIIDDAIVMIEQIVRRVRQTGGVTGGVLAAAAEFSRPLAGSSAATVVVFVPLAFLGGVTGGFFGPLSLTVASSLIFSFLITWLAVPLAAERLVTGKETQREDVGPVSRWIFARYRAFAGRLLARPVLAILGVLPLLVLGFVAFKGVGSGFMPAMDEGGFIIDYLSPPGTALSETDRLVRQVEDILAATPEVATWSRRTGAGLGGDLAEPNKGDFFVRLKPGPRRPIDEIMAEVRAKIIQDVPGLSVEMAQLMEDLIGDLTSVPQPIEVKLFTDDPKTLLDTAGRVAAGIAKIPGVVDVRNGINPAGDSLDVRIDQVKAGIEGVDPTETTRLLNNYLYGQVATQIPTQIKQIGVRVWSPPAARATDSDLANFLVRAFDGHLFPLKRIANFVPVSGEPEIARENLQQMVAVTARIEGRDLGSVAADVRKTLGDPGVVPNSVRFELGGAYAQQQIAFRGLAAVFGAAVAAVFVLLLFLYESFATAIAILIMPLLAVCAGFIGLWVTGIELNITAMMGMTMIVGIVTEVAIFFFSEFVDLAAGRPLSVALVEAGQNRMRPIAMTTLAAILTLLPLALAIGQGSSMQQPLAVAIISGLIVQLPLVLLVMPSIFFCCAAPLKRSGRAQLLVDLTPPRKIMGLGHRGNHPSATCRPRVALSSPCSLAATVMGRVMADLQTLNLILFVAGTFTAALVTGVAGFAFGIVAAAVWLHFLPPAQTTALIVAYGLIVQGISVWKLRRSIRLVRLTPFLLGGAIGVPIGVELLGWTSSATLRLSVGIVLIFFSLYSLVRPQVAPVTAGRAIDGAIGVLNGIVGGATGLAGIALTIWCTLRGWPRDEQRTVFQPVGVAVFLMTGFWLGGAGLIGADTLRLFVIGLPVLLAGTWVGLRLYARLDEAGFRKVVLGLLLISGLGLIMRGS